MKPPYEITPAVLQLIAAISEQLGRVNAAHLQQPPALLRRSNRIQTIQSTLQIEGNTLDLDQVTAILDNRRIIAPAKDIREVQNAMSVYDQIQQFKPYRLSSFLQAHKLLLSGLVSHPGKFRVGAVGIAKGNQLTHLAPPGSQVRPLLNNLFQYLKKDPDLLLIKSIVFHYELEFIHPFTDGNGRMGRLWQTVLLKEYHPVFVYLPVEGLIRNRQKDYYKSLNLSDKSGHSTPFLSFMLHLLQEALEQLLYTQRPVFSMIERLMHFQILTGKSTFTRLDYRRCFPEIAPATASRDLKAGVEEGRLLKTGDKRTSSYRFK